MANENDTSGPVEHKALLRAAGIAGGQAALARTLGVEPPTVNQWAKGHRPIPDDKCVAIEVASGGKVGCEELAPDRCWVRIADANWPHPKGRPLIDLSAANESPSAKAA